MYSSIRVDISHVSSECPNEGIPPSACVPRPSITSTLPVLEGRVERSEPRAEAPPPLRASDTFSTTKHVSLCSALSALNADLFKLFLRFCDVCWPIDAHPIAGKADIRFSLFGWWGWLHIYLFCWSFGAIFRLGLFKYPGTLARWWCCWWRKLEIRLLF